MIFVCRPDTDTAVNPVMVVRVLRSRILLNGLRHLLLIALFIPSWCVSGGLLGFSMWCWVCRELLIGGVLHHRHSQAVNGFQSVQLAAAKAQLIRITDCVCCLEILYHSYLRCYMTIPFPINIPVTFVTVYLSWCRINQRYARRL